VAGKPNKWRFQTCIFILTGLLLVLIIRLYGIQITKHEELKRKALEQQEDIVILEPARGTIYDRNGHKLTINIEVDSVFVNPREVERPVEMSRALSPLLGMSSQDIYNKITNKTKYFVWLKRKLEKEESEKIKALNLKGVYFIKEPKRFYPEADLASHLIGFVGVDNRGLDGIENSYDKYLRGTSIKAVIQKDGAGRNVFLKEQDSNFGWGAEGNEITLTIDEVIQHIAQREIKNALIKYRARNAIIIVMDPQTGEVLALANEPTFNPNEFSKYPAEYRRNKAVTDMFEPGSTFKIITASAAIEEEIVKVDDKFNCEDGIFKFKVGPGYRTVKDVHKYNILSFSEIIRYSSNIGMTKVGMKIGEDRLYDYICAFGFGESTEIGLCGESKGLLRPLNKWSKISITSIPYGQEIAVTPIQIITAVSAIANGGILMKPQVIRSIREYKGKTIFEFAPVSVRRVVSLRTSRKLMEMLEDAVENGTGIQAKIPGYRIAGKTGTSQKINPITKQYDPKNFVSSFIGYFPAENPKIIICVLIDEPKGEYYGGVVAAPVFKKVAHGIIDYLKIFSEKKSEESSLHFPSASIQREDNLTGNLSGPQNDTGEITMPDLTGKTMRSVIEILKKYSVKVILQGTGIVRSQSPAPGSSLKEGQEVLIKFGPNYEKPILKGVSGQR